MKWYEANSVEELKKMGSFRAVKMEINNDIKSLTGKKKLDGFIKMGSNSWKGQLDKILALKKVTNIFNENNGQSINNDEQLTNNNGQAINKGQINNNTSNKNEEFNDNNEDYFKSKADKYIYCLLELSGEQRMKQLKIYKSLYINKEAAKEWYMNIAKNIHPDICKSKKAAEAMAELRSIYNNMVNNE